MTARSSGFTLIELLVVVAIIGILSAVGTVAYNGYVGGAQKKAAESIMQQIALAQTEEYSMAGEYWVNVTGDTCTASEASNAQVETNLFDGSEIVDRDSDFYFCVFGSSIDFTVKADNGDGCVLTLPRNGSIDKSSC
mgnify:CR=1 FL=1|tara:strand:- start:175 stop:585 length:411 start_codon:yes stop_codon:yes gene_type:complete